MKTLLLVSATQMEIAPLLAQLAVFQKEETVYQLSPTHQLEVVITGVGMTATALALGTHYKQAVDVAINAGVAGSFVNHEPGTLVNVLNDLFSELGAEDNDAFLSIDALGLGSASAKANRPYRSPLIQSLPSVKGITVNTVHGHAQSIEKIKARYQPDVESMEGAAFLLAAETFGWKAAQIRSISNAVETRDKSKWQMGKAVQSLNSFLFSLIQEWQHDSH